MSDFWYERSKPELDDNRAPCERDRDRILYCSAFRRLAAVTQVVCPNEGHVFHNRLTHSLETAQIGTRLAERLIKKHKDKAKCLGNIDVDAVEAACLAHDLGHPPFGHVAENELNRLVTEVQHEQDGYEGNAQSFRIVTKLAVRDETKGLNLTRVTLNAILKYPNYRELHKNKWGAYRTEEKIFDFAREGSQEGLPGVEAAIMTWADDIAYAVHDTEDFYRARLIPLEKLTGETEEFEKFTHEVFERWRVENKTFDEENCKEAFLRFCGWIQITEPYSGTRSQRLQIRGLTSLAIGYYIRNTELTDNPSAPLRFNDPVLKDQLEMLKQLVWHYVIKRPSLAGQQHGHRRIIQTLFGIFADATFGTRLDWVILPARFQEEMEILYERYGGSIPHCLRVRTAADAVAGLTDTEAFRLHLRVTGADAGSVKDPIVA